LQWKGILKVFGMLNMVVGLLMLSVPLIDLLTLQAISYYFLLTALALIASGYLLSRLKAPPLSTIESVVLASIAWPLISFEASIPLMLSLKLDFVDAFFESVSGFTGTGFTVLKGLDFMKPSIITWRSIMQWSGELGIVVFAMILFPYFYRYGARVYGLERPLKIEASFYRSAQRIASTYFILTLVGIIACVYTGMSLYEAVNHTLVGIATGGIPMYDEGYERVFQRAPYTYAPIMALMFLGGMNFMVLDKMLRGDLRSVKRSEEFRAYLILMLVVVLATILSYIVVDGYELDEALLAGVLNAVSGLTTTGFSLGDLHNLKPLTKIIIIIAMFIGGMSFSTAGGIKVYRLLVLVKKLKNSSISMITGGRFEKPVKVDDHVLDESEISTTVFFPLLHTLATTTAAALITTYGYDFIDALFESVSAASCVGLSSRVLTPTSPIGVKLVLIALMLFGRLEYVQVFLLIGYIAGRRILEVVK